MASCWRCRGQRRRDATPHAVEHGIDAGYAGNGMTFGTLAGIMIADAIVGRRNPWTDLFDPGRKALTQGLWDYITENLDYPYYKIRDRFAGAETRSSAEVTSFWWIGSRSNQAFTAHLRERRKRG